MVRKFFVIMQKNRDAGQAMMGSLMARLKTAQAEATAEGRAAK